MRKKLKLSSDGGDSTSKKCKPGYGGAYGGVWRSLPLAGVWSQAAGFVLVRLTGNLASVAVKMFSTFIYFVKKNINFIVGFEVLTAVSTKMAVFWVIALCSLVEVYQRFRGLCCLHHQGDALMIDYTALQPRRQPSS
jgi:hypothetical protein